MTSHNVTPAQWIAKAGGCYVPCQRMGQGTKASHERELAISELHGVRRVVDFHRCWSHRTVDAVLSCGCHVNLMWMPIWQREQCLVFLRRLQEVFPEWEIEK